MNNRRAWANFFLAASLLTAVMIFLFSAQQGPESAELSNGVTLTVAKVVKPNYESLPPAAKVNFLNTLSTVIRKNAHFCEFALLGFNLMGLFRLRRWERPALSSLPLAWGVATLYAGTDELHQLFVSERGPALLDVGIDSAGALTGTLLALLVLHLVLKRAIGNRH